MHGKKLLFFGTAMGQTGRIGYMARPFPGRESGITPAPREISVRSISLRSDIHGITTPHPIPALAAHSDIALFCSTGRTGAYGSEAKKTEVPRKALMERVR